MAFGIRDDVVRPRFSLKWFFIFLFYNHLAQVDLLAYPEETQELKLWGHRWLSVLFRELIAIMVNGDE